MPLLLNLVPALRQDRREINVRAEGKPDVFVRIGADDRGMVMVSTNPRMADVRIRDASNASFSWGSNCDLNLTRGWIMYEFHRNDSSRLSISNFEDSADLDKQLARLTCMIRRRLPILKSVCEVEVCAVVKTAIAQQLLQVCAWVLYNRIPPTQVLSIRVIVCAICPIEANVIARDVVMLGAV
jgi:hypothetical protein